MKEIGLTIFVAICFFTLSAFSIIMLYSRHHDNKKIETNEKKTAVIKDITKLKMGNSQYIIALKQGTSTREFTAQSNSAWNVYAYGEEVEISMQSGNSIIIDEDTQYQFIGHCMFLGGFLALLLLFLLSLKVSSLAFCCLAMITGGLSLLSVCGTNYHYEEGQVFLANGTTVEGIIVEYIEHICERRRKSSEGVSRKIRYRCYERVVEYLPLGTQKILTMKGRTKSEIINRPIGTKIKVIYLKSNHNIARAQGNIASSQNVYFGVAISLFFIYITLRLLKKAVFTDEANEIN